MLSHSFFFFFKQKTAYEMRISDWSSDVCSSDLLLAQAGQGCERTVGPAVVIGDVRQFGAWRTRVRIQRDRKVLHHDLSEVDTAVFERLRRILVRKRELDLDRHLDRWTEHRLHRVVEHGRNRSEEQTSAIQSI